MKKLLIASAAALVLGASGAQADSAFEGLYAGVEGSYGNFKADGGGKDGAFAGGAFAGYGFTFDKIYLGAEGGVNVSGTEFTHGGLTYSRRFGYGATAKAGYLVTPKHLAYGLAGYERAEFKASDGTKGTNDGFRFGIGGETVVRNNITARTELSYTDWNDRDGMPKAGEWRGTVGFGIRF